MSCPHTDGCELYAKFVMQSTVKLWKIHYCDNDRRYPECARFKLTKEGKPIPPTLLPNGEDLGGK